VCPPALLPNTLQAFAEVLANNESWSAPMDDTYELLGVDPASITSLEQYLQVGRGRGVMQGLNWCRHGRGVVAVVW
jgi:hypothetical protein